MEIDQDGMVRMPDEMKAKIEADAAPKPIPLLEELAFMEWLMRQGYKHPRPIGCGRYACIMPLMFTHAIITGQIGNFLTTEDRWCYHGEEKAKAALDAWNPSEQKEPSGWHRHPYTGRRRDEDGTEYIAP